MNPLNHVAVIMDGNGRWGLKYKKSRNDGHKAGLNTVEKIIKETIKQKIHYLTLYAFSTENWKRPKFEIDYLFLLLETFLKKKITKINQQNIRLRFIGDKKKLKNSLTKKILHAEKLTKLNQKLQINIAINYGSKYEIINTIKILNKKKLTITEKNFENNLLTKGVPDPEILIRTGNTCRLSNFLLWQLAYTEIFFEKKLWPDFNDKDFNRIINSYDKIKRNFGDI